MTHRGLRVRTSTTSAALAASAASAGPVVVVVRPRGTRLTVAVATRLSQQPSTDPPQVVHSMHPSPS